MDDSKRLEAPRHLIRRSSCENSLELADQLRIDDANQIWAVFQPRITIAINIYKNIKFPVLFQHDYLRGTKISKWNRTHRESGGLIIAMEFILFGVEPNLHTLERFLLSHSILDIYNCFLHNYHIHVSQVWILFVLLTFISSLLQDRMVFFQWHFVNRIKSIIVLLICSICSKQEKSSEKVIKDEK